MEKTRKYFMYFILYSIFGWCYEVFLEVFIYKWGFSNRGVLFGPYCPVYGVGALAFIFMVYPLIKDKDIKKRIIMIPVVFVLTMITATVIELISSYICELIFGSWPWQTYVSYKYNFQARIALSPSIRFGIGGILFLYILQPIFEKFCNNIGKKRLTIISNIIFVLLVIDSIYTFIIK